MDLKGLMDESGLQQDEWSLTAPKFGEEGQLSVVGWSGRRGYHKLYILKCSKCSKDNELFGDGYFGSVKGGLIRGTVPCGCSACPRWNKEQYGILCSRKAQELCYKFLGFIGEWNQNKTKIKMFCEKHGEWSSGAIDTLVSNEQGCPGCRSDTNKEANTKPNDVMIQSFFASGGFHPDTVFWRSERKTGEGRKVYWHMYCPECGETGESASGHLQRGSCPCACSRMKQQEAYINWIMDEEEVVAIKFGIARNSKQRIKRQNRVSVYTMKQHLVYTFPDVTSCKKAERECKKELDTGVVLKRDMPDGYTETTYTYNLDKIVEIYQRNGGILNDRQ